MSKKLKLTLSLTVEYDLNGESPEVLKDHLLHLANHGVANGMLSGDTKAEVDSWEARVDAIPPGEHVIGVATLQTDFGPPDEEGDACEDIHRKTDVDYRKHAIVQAPEVAHANSPNCLIQWLATLEDTAHVYIDDDGTCLRAVGDDDAYLELGGHPLPLLTEKMFVAHLKDEGESIDPEQAFRELCLEGDGADWRRRERVRSGAEPCCKLELDDSTGFRMGVNNYADGQVKDRQWISFDNGSTYFTAEDVKKALFHFDESEYDYDPELRSQVDWWL